MHWITALEQFPRMVKTIEGAGPYVKSVGPYLKSLDFERYLDWWPRRRARTSWLSLVGAFGAGVVVGAGAALLASPQAGPELRMQLKSKLNTLAHHTREAMPFRKSNGHGDIAPASESAVGGARI